MRKLSIVNWNVQRKNPITGYTFLKTIKLHLSTISPDIIILQEMCDARKILKKIPFQKTYHVFIPKLNQKKYNRVAGYNFNVILSKYPIIETREIVFPKFNHRAILQNCTRVKIKLNGKHLLIYNCQLTIIKAGMATRLKQLEYLLSDAHHHKGPILICGDMNSVIPKSGWNREMIALWDRQPRKEMFVDGKLISYEEKELFSKTIKKYGFRDALKLSTPTWSPLKSKIWEMFKLKLDWFIVKDLKVTSIELDDYITDHKSIEAEVRL